MRGVPCDEGADPIIVVLLAQKLSALLLQLSYLGLFALDQLTNLLVCRALGDGLVGEDLQ